MQRYLCPLNHNELQGGASTPEQGSHRQRDLTQAIIPKRLKADGEIFN